MRIVILFVLFFTTILVAESNLTKEYHIEIHTSLNKEDIAKTIGVKQKDIFNFWSDKDVITQDFVDNIKPTLKGYLESIGYFDSRVDVNIVGNKIIINIDEGEAVRVSDIKINSDFDIKSIVNWKKGDIFSSDRFDKIKSNIEKKLQENGYCNAKIDTKAYVDLKQHSAKLNYNIKKGEICYFGKILIEKKPKDIKKEVILSRIKYNEGDIFDIRKIEDSYNSLNSLNTFANLQIKYDLDTKTRYVDSTVSLDLKDKLRRYLFGIGIDSEVGVRAKALWERRDFLGNAKKVTVKTAISKDKQEISTELFIPAFLSYKNVYTDLYILAGYSLEEANVYREKLSYINSYLDYSYKRWNLKLGIELERLIIKLEEDLPSKIGGIFNILYPYASIEYDARDSKIDPKNGYYFKLYGEYGLSFGDNSVEYFKYTLEARTIKSFGDLTLSAVGKMGAIHEKSLYLPASKLFYGGGLFSNRAYGKDKIGYITSNKTFSSLGGKSFLNLQLEANYKIHKRFYGAIFFDSTLISQKEYNFKGKRIDTLGFGLRYKTLIGPIKIDVGFNIHNTKDYAISIMLGQSF